MLLRKFNNRQMGIKQLPDANTQSLSQDGGVMNGCSLCLFQDFEIFVLNGRRRKE